MLAGFRAQLDFFENQLRAELAQFADVLLQILAFGKVFDDFFELGAGVAVALAFEVQPHDLQAAFEVAGFHGGGEDAA